MMRTGLIAIAMAVCVMAQGPPPGGARTGVALPEGAGRDTTLRVCGSTCHGPDVMTGAGRTREQWTAVVNQMVTRGAKGTDAELGQVITYLSAQVGPGFRPPAARAQAGPGGGFAQVATGRGPGPLGSGAADSHVVDRAGAERGKTLYAAECANCHGVKARGGNEALPDAQRGSDLIRSLVVLRDRYGSLVSPFLAKGHPMRSGRDAKVLTPEQAGDLAHFLHQRVYGTLRNGGELGILNILSGDKQAGMAYFNGAGKCVGCHSVEGDFKGIGRKYDAVTLQQKFLFPRTVAFGRGGPAPPAGKPVNVTVTTAGGQKAAGTLVSLDDFNVALRDAEGNYRSFTRGPGVTVVKNDPLDFHVALLDEIADKNIHDVVAYMESLK